MMDNSTIYLLKILHQKEATTKQQKKSSTQKKQKQSSNLQFLIPCCLGGKRGNPWYDGE